MPKYRECLKEDRDAHGLAITMGRFRIIAFER